MSDPLSLLRAHILSQDPIELTDNSGNKKTIQEFTHFKFNNVLLPRNALLPEVVVVELVVS